MFLRFRVQWLTFCMLMGLCQCGTEQDSQLQGGSWGGHVGGSFFEADLQNLTHGLARAEFYYVTKPVGFGINHEYIGIKLTRQNAPAEFYTSGLIAEDDLTYFQEQLTAGERFLFAATEQPGELARIKQTSDQYFQKSWFQNPAVFTGGMVLTPLLGRPCAKVARLLKKKILSHLSGDPTSGHEIGAGVIAR